MPGLRQARLTEYRPTEPLYSHPTEAVHTTTTMPLKRLLATKLSGTQCYRCTYCDLSFDDERLNCPACGFEVREAN